MGKRSAVVELFLGDMGSMQRELRPSIQREDQLTMETKLEQIAVKARREPNLRFTSLTHHITRDRVLENLSKIPKRSAAGVDGQTVEAAKESFKDWIGPMLQSIHRQSRTRANGAMTNSGKIQSNRIVSLSAVAKISSSENCRCWRGTNWSCTRMSCSNRVI
jgi:hypothetical protein